ncbi:hypothetical protein EDF87_107139 [Pseudomonas helmanticensis]|jgi:hypothetical protein|uniref:Uncharacterized protein n=1 Tax=Pseudomonas helmanticensis TaxID=1471381 RepID=A0A4R7VCJ6_9PSED|nr:hypothetical protein EDF87_107139 [Pseudomonas helmanticensis]
MSKFFDELMESVQEMDEILRRERRASSPTFTPNTDDETALSFEQKQAYFDKVRRSNYLASLHLEGFDTQRTDTDKTLPLRESALEKHRRNKN